MEFSIKEMICRYEIEESTFALESIVNSSVTLAKLRASHADRDDVSNPNFFKIFPGGYRKRECDHLLNQQAYHISKLLIDIATKTRIFQDLVGKEIIVDDDESDGDRVFNPDKDVSEHFPGFFEVLESSGKGEESIRNSCNKIIHAEKMTLGTLVLTEINDQCRCWDGNVYLSCNEGNPTWSVRIDVNLWVRAINEYHHSIHDFFN